MPDTAKKTKVVIAGSAKLQDEMRKWFEYWNGLPGHEVTAHPKVIPPEDFDALYPDVHKEFFAAITEADVLFVANERKGDVDGYIGPETFAELAFGLAQRLVYGKDIKLILARMPSPEVPCHDEIVLWRRLGWVEIMIREPKA